jgi:hypothetical protein
MSAENAATQGDTVSAPLRDAPNDEEANLNANEGGILDADSFTVMEQRQMKEFINHVQSCEKVFIENLEIGTDTLTSGQVRLVNEDRVNAIRSSLRNNVLQAMVNVAVVNLHSMFHANMEGGSALGFFTRFACRGACIGKATASYTPRSRQR